MEVIVHHGGILEDYGGVRIDIPDDLEIAIAEVPHGWPDGFSEAVTADLGTRWMNERAHAVLRVRSATMSESGFNYLLNPAHPFVRISFNFEAVRRRATTSDAPEQVVDLAGVCTGR